MPIRTAKAEWDGSLKDGVGRMTIGAGVFQGRFTSASRFEEAEGINPEDLIGAAHSGCFSMSLSAGLGKAGYTPKHIATTAEVSLDLVEGARTITKITLHTQAEVPGIDEATFQELAENAKKNCPVSRALAGVDITLKARLIN
jgi:osmotically inducible protein OsmC